MINSIHESLLLVHHTHAETLNVSFIPYFVFWFLVTFGNKVKKIGKYYVIFVYILQGKMCKTEKKTKRKSHN